ncbi:MAG: peptidoglycan editing factor PgeF [Terracidiphilus sp.]
MPSSSSSNPAPGLKTTDLQGIDTLFAEAGLARSRRGKSSGSMRAERLDRAAPEEFARPAPRPRIAANGVRWLPVPGWGFAWLWSGFSTRLAGRTRAYCADDAPGELNLGFTAEDSRETVAGNRQLLAEAATGTASTPLVTLRQFHSNLVVRVSAADAGRKMPRRGDGLITDQPGMLLAVQTADCIPVLVADRKSRVVGAFHAGWRGTVKRIVEAGVGRMRLEFDSRPGDLIAAIGPGIGPCCYAVGDEVLSEFESQFSYARELFCEVSDADAVRMKYPMLFLTQRAPGHASAGPGLHVDLIEANRRQLLACGIAAKSIQVVGSCTQCHPGLFFSHRGSRGRAGRMMAVIGIRKPAWNQPASGRRIGLEKRKSMVLED